MDLYTTAFTYPTPPTESSRHTGSPNAAFSTPAQTTGPGIGAGADTSGSSAALSATPGTGSISTIPLPLVNISPSLPPKSSVAYTTPAQLGRDWEAVQKLALDITTREGCLVTVTKEQIGVVDNGSTLTATEVPEDPDTPIPQTTVWNFHLSGGYQPVMAARGGILREAPRDNLTTFKVSRSEILESPFSTVSPLKEEVGKKLEGIVAESKAQIKVISPDESGAIGGTVLAIINEDGVKHPANPTNVAKKSSANGEGKANGMEDPGTCKKTSNEAVNLETERTCGFAVTGSTESVELAKLRILVMLDELNGLHAEPCDIDYKLHNVIAGRKRHEIERIQEQTATNIYFSTPLVGVLDPPQPGSQQGAGYRYLQMNMPGPSHMSMPPPGPMGMQMTGSISHGPNGGMSMNGMGGMPMGMHGMGGNFPQQQQHHPHNRNAPQYNPHQHVHYPYQPQPLNIDPSTTRGMPYSGPGIHYPMHHGPPPMSMNHTGMSAMHTGFGNGQNRMGSPMPPHGQHPGMNMHHGAAHPHQSSYQGQTLHAGMANHNLPMGLPPMGMPPMGIGMGMDSVAQHNGQHPGLQVHGGEQGRLGKANQIWITGEFFGVQRARDMLLNRAMQKCKLVISRDAIVPSRKLDWLLTEKVEEMKTIMSDNGTYLQLPSVGSQTSLISVFGDHRVTIERTIRSIMALACQFIKASFWLLPTSFDVLMPQSSLNPAQMQPILKSVAHATGAEVVFKSNCFEMHGLEEQVRAAVGMVLELDIIENFHREIQFQIELANEHRDFISGKKNGKINKIMKVAGVKIKFETFNDYNFLIEVSGSDGGALQGLTMLQEELPAEMSFHVPESYHKRIIGVSGKNIQKIMKIHGVYVKFLNAEEFATMGGFSDNEDNVVARTPAKNSANLDSLKQAVMEMVAPKDKDYTTESLSIPRKYHRILLGEKHIFIRDIERKTNSIVRFPYKETASDIVTVFGPESQVQIAAAMILDHVPFEADLHVPPNAELSRLVTSTEFIVFTERIKRDHQIAIVPPTKFTSGEETIFKFRCQRSNVHCLDTAREALEEWLGTQNIQVYPKSSNRRGESFSNAFSHFNSKLLATGSQVNAAVAEEEDILVDRRQRAPGEDVRALFNGPGYPNPVADEGALGFGGGLYQDRSRDLWTGSNNQPPPVPRRTESDHQKRDSDPIINDRLRQTSHGHNSSLSHRHPHHQHRMTANRHQSLDISQLNFSRALSGGSSSFGPMPPSPTAANSSPNTASGPYFPHVGPHPIRANVTGRGGGYGGNTSSDVDSITQPLANIQVSHQ